jgi:hypothetical protein
MIRFLRRGGHAWNGTRRLGRRNDGAWRLRLGDVDARNGAGAHRRIGDAGSGGSVARHDGAGADHVGDDLCGTRPRTRSPCGRGRAAPSAGTGRPPSCPLGSTTCSTS